MNAAYKRQVMIAAYFKAQGDLTQKAIGEKAGLGTQAQVSKLLHDARTEGILREVFVFPPDISERERRIVEQSYFPLHDELERALIDRSRDLASMRRGGTSPFKRLHVVPSLEYDASKPQEQADAFRVFGEAAAEIVAGYINNTETCSVAWGRTLDATLKFIPESSRVSPKKVFMPIAGEPTNHEPNGVSPSDAARILADRWPPSESYSLRGVQARIPKSVADRDTQGIARDLAFYSKSYQMIFGRPGATERPLIAKVGMILTGIGDVTTSENDPWYAETADAEDQSVLQLTQGNIGGIWIPRLDLSEDAAEQVNQMNKRWLGAQLDHFVHCSRGSDLERHPGVVVLAVEPGKAEIVLEALDLINVLIVSHSLAAELAWRTLGKRVD